jgi:hypothetical protein
MEHTEKESSTGHNQDQDGRCSKQDDEVILIYLKWKYEITSFEFIEQFVVTHITPCGLCSRCSIYPKN